MPSIHHPLCGSCGHNDEHVFGSGCWCGCRYWTSPWPRNYDIRISGVTGRIRPEYTREFQERAARWKKTYEPFRKQLQAEEQRTARGRAAGFKGIQGLLSARLMHHSKESGVASISSLIPSTSAPKQLMPPSQNFEKTIATVLAEKKPAKMCWCGLEANPKYKNGWCGGCR